MLPYEHVRSTFDTLCQEADDANDPRLDRLTVYMHNRWMESAMWKVSEWVVFMEPVQQVSLKQRKKYQCERRTGVTTPRDYGQSPACRGLAPESMQPLSRRSKYDKERWKSTAISSAILAWIQKKGLIVKKLMGFGSDGVTGADTRAVTSVILEKPSKSVAQLGNKEIRRLLPAWIRALNPATAVPHYNQAYKRPAFWSEYIPWASNYRKPEDNGGPGMAPSWRNRLTWDLTTIAMNRWGYLKQRVALHFLSITVTAELTLPATTRRAQP
ncbi:Hypp8295 [Branchiostoma lanceolatum]|uniref:Hypp8295 protein n=1 Tax=Branchiostoma lanceolatum TaxID=7740 RepID=A0A8J9Z7Q6_BRALA|nr:Hypp8295 [Branchiostoma lanceolatum]